MQCQETLDILPVTVTMIPTSKTKTYTVSTENGEEIEVKRKHLYDGKSVPASGTPSISLGFFTPGWMKQDQQVTLLHQDKYRKGFLNLNDKGFWEFVTRGRDG